MSENVEIGSATLYRADAKTIVDHLSGRFVLVTDPPYGVDFKGKATKHTKASGGYNCGDSNVGPSIVCKYLEVCERGIVFPGMRLMFDYPRPYEIGFISTPSGAGMSRWGFAVGHPMLFYGKATKSGRQSPNGFTSFALASDDRHPCAKPLEWMTWAVRKASESGDTVIDPFMGSGTTGVACAHAGRSFVGIEIDREYFDIACERIAMAHAQGRLFE